PGHHERSHPHRRDGRHVRGGADRSGEAVGDPAADHPPAPAEIKDRRQEQAERDEPEPDQLEVLLALLLPASLARPFLDARGQAWLERALLTASRHARDFYTEETVPTSQAGESRTRGRRAG